MEVSKWVLAMEVGLGTATVMEDGDEEQDSEVMESTRDDDDVQ